MYAIGCKIANQVLLKEPKSNKTISNKIALKFNANNHFKVVLSVIKIVLLKCDGW